MRRDGCPASRRPDGREWLRCGGWKSALRCCGSAEKRLRNGWKARWRRVRWLRNGSRKRRCCGSGRKNCRKGGKASRCGCPKTSGSRRSRKDEKSNNLRRSSGTASHRNGWRSNRRNGSGCRSWKNGSGCRSCCRKSGRRYRMSCCGKRNRRRKRCCGSWKTNFWKGNHSCCGSCRTNGWLIRRNGSNCRTSGSPIPRNGSKNRTNG